MARVIDDGGAIVVTRRKAVLTVAFGSVALFTACIGTTAAPSGAPPKPAATPAATTISSAQPTAAVAPTTPPASSPAPKPTPAPSKPQTAKVTIAIPALVLAFAPVFIARSRKFFEDEAIEAETPFVQNSPNAISSLVAGEAQFTVTGSGEQLTAVEKGLGFLTIAGFPTSVTVEFAARNEYLQQKGITPKHPLKDKMNALRGAKIGVSSLSGSPFQYGKYAAKLYGLDAEKDVDLIVIQSGPPSVAALREGQVDAFIMSPPDPEVAESEGFGTVFIRLGEEVPVLQKIVYQGVYGKKTWIEQNAGVTERVARAIGRANNLILNDLAAAKEAVRTALPQTSPQLLDLAMDQMKGAFNPDARMTEEMWKNAADVHLFSGLIKALPPVAEGSFWTNKYLVNVPKR